MNECWANESSLKIGKNLGDITNFALEHRPMSGAPFNISGYIVDKHMRLEVDYLVVGIMHYFNRI